MCENCKKENNNVFPSDFEKIFNSISNTQNTTNRKSFSINISFDLDFKFWALLPAINLNFHGFEFEIEWLCFAIYIEKGV